VLSDWWQQPNLGMHARQQAIEWCRGWLHRPVVTEQDAVAPNYARQRSDLARKMGLGQTKK
jgi:hypothetical protein